MWIKTVFLAVTSCSFGLLAAAGVFTVLAAVGLVPRFAGKTHTGKKVILYEEMVIAGTIIGCLSVFLKITVSWACGPWDKVYRRASGGSSVVCCNVCLAFSPACLWAVLPWPLRKCWTASLYLPGELGFDTG